MDPTATKQYVIVGPTSPGDITSGTVTDGSITIYYSKVGKLYFNLGVQLAAGDTGQIGLADTDAPPLSDSADRIAFLLGLTVNTIYYLKNLNTDNSRTPASNNWVYAYDNGGGAWALATGGRPGRYMQGFLAN